MKRKYVMRAASFGLALFLLTLFLGCGSYHHRSYGDRIEYLVKKVSGYLDLNKEQKKRVNAIKDEIMVEGKKMRSIHRELGDAIIKQFSADSFDEKSVATLLQKHENSRKTFQQFLLKKTAEFHAILNPEQREKAVDKMKKFRKRMETR